MRQELRTVVFGLLFIIALLFVALKFIIPNLP